MTDKTPDPPLENILLVFIGCRLDHTMTKLNYCWLVATPDQAKHGKIEGDISSNNTRWYEGKEAKKFMSSVGAVYEVPQEIGTTSIYPGRAKWQCLWPNQDDRTRWQIEHRTASTTIELQKQSKKEGAEDNFAALTPFREKYRKLISQDQKAALLAQMIAYVTSGRK